LKAVTKKDKTTILSTVEAYRRNVMHEKKMELHRAALLGKRKRQKIFKKEE
jgi:hypothetical protein